MKTVQDVFDAAMALMDELNDETGETVHEDTREYQQRTPLIVNTLVAEMRLVSGQRGFWPDVSSLDDPLINVDDGYALGVMSYGLAAKLMIGEDNSRASFLHEKYEDMRWAYFATGAAAVEKIEDVYGGIEYGRFGRW